LLKIGKGHHYALKFMVIRP